MWNQTVGKMGEKIAKAHLETFGVRIIAENYRTEYGEIDLIGFDEGNLVFFEVKTRTSSVYGVPELAITPKKMEHMINCALSYVQDQEIEPDWRIDVLAISLNKKSKESKIEWIKNVTEAN